MSEGQQAAKAWRTSIAPMVSVGNGVKAIEFYKAAFGANAAFWVADESPEHLNFSPATLNGGTLRLG